MITDYLVFVCLYLGGLIVRTSYERLKKAGKVDRKSKITFSIVFAAMCLLWASWFSLCSLDPLRIAVPALARWVALGMFLIGLGLSIGGLFQLRGLENINRLSTTGLFRKLRHPIYTGFILWILSWAIYHGAVISLIFGIVGIGNVMYWQRLEEDSLEIRYGEEYRRYRQGTWF
jgi:protein-S-isoprenylcysteine O-methyltransferase Ste14